MSGPARDAVVVGGGIGGLAAARGLQAAGWSVRVLERAAYLEPLGAGLSLFPNAVRALAALGVHLPPGRLPGSGGIRARDGRWLSRTALRTTPRGTAPRSWRCTAAPCNGRCSTPWPRARS